MNYLNCKNIETAIRRAKKQLKQKAAKQGLYENFGQKEVREITDKFIDCWYTSPDTDKVLTFDRWCSAFNDKSFN